MRKIPRLQRSLSIGLFCAALSACGASQDADAMLVSGRQYLAAGDHKAALIQFKNVLQQRPDSAEARYLLGKTLLDSGDPQAGGIELRKALELNHPEPLLEPLIARSLLLEGKPREVIARYGTRELAQPQARAELQTVLARAHAALGEADAAEAALRAALSLVPGHAEATLLQVRRLAARREFDAAFAQLEALLERLPGMAEAWQFKGDLLMVARKDAPAALDAYRKALGIRKDLVDAHAAIISISLARNDLQAATSQLQALRKLFPGHPQTLYHEAQLALLQRDYAGAQERVNKLLTLVPDDLKVLQLAGWVEFQAGALLQAEAHLAKALQRSPELPLARRLLSQVHLRKGRPDQALALLQPMIDREDAPSVLVSLAAEALLQKGEPEQAEALFARAARLDPQDARSRTALAVARLARGESDAGTAELERIAATDSGTTGDLALISAHLRQKQPQAALKAVERLEKKIPGQALAPFLRGTVLLRLDQRPQARESFERALGLDPVYLPAATSLAQLDLQDGKPQAAQQRFERMLAADPRNVQASLAIVELRARAGANMQELVALLAAAVKRHPTEDRPPLALIDLHLRRNDAPSALRAAQEATAALPASTALQEALGRAQLAAGEPAQAVATFKQLVARHKDSARAHLHLARAQAAAKDLAAAEGSFQRALSLAPGSPEIQRQLASLYLNSGRSPQALALARAMQKQDGNQAAGFQLEGEIEAAGGRWNEAVAAFRSALKQSQSGVLAARLHAALSKSGAQAQADDFAGQWIRQHPQDIAFRLHLGELAVAREDYARAETHFLQVLAAQPDHAVALNNLAWALLKQGKPGASAHAEKAHRLQPDQPAILDTLAQTLAQEKQWSRAIEFQKRATELAPRDPGLRLGLARLYLGAGQKTQAREELDRLRTLGQGFARQAEVEQLLQTL